MPYRWVNSQGILVRTSHDRSYLVVDRPSVPIAERPAEHAAIAHHRLWSSRTGSITGRDRSRHLTVSLSSLATEQRWLTRPPRTSMTPHRRSADRTCTVFEIDAVAGSARDGSLKPCGGAPLP